MGEGCAAHEEQCEEEGENPSYCETDENPDKNEKKVISKDAKNPAVEGKQTDLDAAESKRLQPKVDPLDLLRILGMNKLKFVQRRALPSQQLSPPVFGSHQVLWHVRGLGSRFHVRELLLTVSTGVSSISEV
jgi:hypothetical protein